MPDPEQFLRDESLLLDLKTHIGAPRIFPALRTLKIGLTHARLAELEATLGSVKSECQNRDIVLILHVRDSVEGIFFDFLGDVNLEKQLESLAATLP
jgi:hypothetical protein